MNVAKSVLSSHRHICWGKRVRKNALALGEDRQRPPGPGTTAVSWDPDQHSCHFACQLMKLPSMKPPKAGPRPGVILWKCTRPLEPCCESLAPCASDADVNECRRPSEKRTCQHSCHNTLGSFTCGCRPGYRLSADRVSCEGKGLCEKSLRSIALGSS